MCFIYYIPIQLFCYSQKAQTSFTVRLGSHKQPMSFQVCNRLAVVVIGLSHQLLEHISEDMITVREMEENS